jgi:hypothetical protein
VTVKSISVTFAQSSACSGGWAKEDEEAEIEVKVDLFIGWAAGCSSSIMRFQAQDPAWGHQSPPDALIISGLFVDDVVLHDHSACVATV